MIVIDSREHLSVQTQFRLYLAPQDVRVRKLDVGDMLLFDNCPAGHVMGIERKTVHDFLCSMGDDRLHRQAKNMAEMYSHSLLIIEGPVYEVSIPGQEYQSYKGRETRRTNGGRVVARGRETGWNHGAVQMAILGLQRRLGVPVLWTGGIRETADVLRVLGKRGDKGCFDDTRGHSTEMNQHLPPNGLDGAIA